METRSDFGATQTATSGLPQPGRGSITVCRLSNGEAACQMIMSELPFWMGVAATQPILIPRCGALCFDSEHANGD